MDKQTEQINKILFDIFGLSPEYKVVWTDKEYFEFYEPDLNFRYNYYGTTGGTSTTNNYTIKTRLHVIEHQVKLDSGIVVSARFAVHHPSKTIYLQIVDIGGNRAWSMYTYGK